MKLPPLMVEDKQPEKKVVRDKLLRQQTFRKATMARKSKFIQEVAVNADSIIEEDDYMEDSYDSDYDSEESDAAD